jgi:hypothetical protein
LGQGPETKKWPGRFRPGLGKFWERMPERHDLNAGSPVIVQVRKPHFMLRNLQLLFTLLQFCCVF